MIDRMNRVLRQAARDPRASALRARLKARLALLRAVNRLSRRPVTGTGRAVVNLTSFGHRVDLVYYALESIAAGSVRPRRLILWLDEPDALADPPRTLRRLQSRGLEIRACADYGPHKKQYAYVTSAEGSASTLPLVAADDDVLYPRDWLTTLLDAAHCHPGEILGFRAHRMQVSGDRIAPYAQWQPVRGTEPGYRVLCTGVSGILYPPAFLPALRLEGERFREVAPRADDVWVHSVAVRHGFRSRQVTAVQAEFPAIPGSQKGTLYRENVKDGGNDAQVAASYGPAEIDRLHRDDPRDSGPLAVVAAGADATDDTGAL